MFYVIKCLYCLAVECYEKYADPRTMHLPLVYSPLPSLLVIASYLAFVLNYGPKWMEKRKAFQLKSVMQVYNGIQVIANFVLLVGGVRSVLHKNYSFVCQPIETTNTDPLMMDLIYVTYGYYMTKYLDLLDTIFIVLRKKHQQISFLHVYHHAGMVFGVYFHITFMAGSHTTMLGLVNLFVHTVMYTYYFLTSLRPIKEALWWKRYITQVQLMQFGYLALHFAQVFFRNSCDFPFAIAVIGFMQNIFMFVLFFEFYYRSYIKKPKAASSDLINK